MERVLVTGAASWTGGRLIQRLEVRPDTKVLGIDDRPPKVPFDSATVRGGLDQVDVAEQILDFRPNAVVHLDTLDRGGDRGGGMVVGARALFGAISRCEDTTRVVIRSDGAVYGAGPRSPSVFSESTPAVGRPTSHQRRLRDLEDFVATLDHDSVSYTVLRFGAIIGPTINNPLTRYLRLPVVPTHFGFDPRLQFINEDDAVRALLWALERETAGTFNIAGLGQVYLSRVLRLGRRLPQPLPGRVFRSIIKGLSGIDIPLADDVRQVLRYGRVLDTQQMRTGLAFLPRMTCRQAVLAAYGRISPEALPEEAVAGGG